MQEPTGTNQCAPSWMHECSECTGARAEGLQSWMHHLISDHVLPTEWPSDRVAKLPAAMAQKPYTVITESKKKRKKDSIPRPLNSFMIFAQHIRRNVLRVFSDASNSVISRQLGDLWRTVPRAYRNLYDEEANRLVKIHQMEYPDYKYQPKKRQHQHQHQQPQQQQQQQQQQMQPTLTTPGCGNSAGSSQPNHWITLPIRTPTPSHDSVPVVKVEIMNESESLSPSISTVVQHMCIKPELQQVSAPDDFTFMAANGCSEESTSLFTRGTSKRQRWESSGGRVENIRTSSLLTGHSSESGSLSTVLPPLLTSSSGKIYDSAYASGINSSSSSSASSPAIGDASPNKSMAVYSSKASPTRRRFHFIPIRPRSQQGVPLSGPQQPVVRQRFLSANNDYTLSATYDFTPSPLASSPASPTGSGVERNPPLPVAMATVTQDRVIGLPGGKTQSVSVQTPGDKCRPLSQTVNNISGASRRVLIANAVEPALPAGRLVQLLRQPDSRAGNSARQVSIVNYRSQGATWRERDYDHVKTVLLIPASAPGDVSCPYTAPSQGVQESYTVGHRPNYMTPRQADRFIDLANGLRTTVVPERAPTKEKQVVYQVSSDESGNRVVALAPDVPYVSGGADLNSTLLDGANTVLVDGIITDWWPNNTTSGIEPEPTAGEADEPVDFKFAKPEEEDRDSDHVIVISSPSSDGSASLLDEKTLVNADHHASDTDDVDCNFDCNFDSLMNSIDISNFLPDPFITTPSGIEPNSPAAADHPEVDSMELPGISFSPEAAADAMVFELGAYSSPAVCHGCFRKSSSRIRRPILNSGDNIILVDRQTHGQAITSVNNDQYHYDRPGQDDGNHQGDGVREHSRQAYEESLLSDLDALDKSSLFPLKPDWSVLA